jgi:hypothetical protein
MSEGQGRQFTGLLRDGTSGSINLGGGGGGRRRMTIMVVMVSGEIPEKFSSPIFFRHLSYLAVEPISVWWEV